MTMHQPMAEVALAAAITTNRRGRKAPTRFQRQGSLDKRVLHRVPAGDCRVFKRQSEPAKSRIRVSILLDCSGSMRTRIGTATQVARNLAGATDRLPWVTADLIGFSTSSDGVTLYPLWRTGEATNVIDRRVSGVQMGGTDEGMALAWALDDLIAERDAATAQLMIIISDGQPGDANHVKYVVGQARRQGVPIVGVSLVPGLTERQYAMYGRENVVEYTPNVKILARGMAKVIGRVL